MFVPLLSAISSELDRHGCAIIVMHENLKFLFFFLYGISMSIHAMISIRVNVCSFALEYFSDMPLQALNEQQPILL